MAHPCACSAFFDELAPRWDSIGGPESEERISRWCASVALPKDAVVLDVGCGTGISSRALAECLVTTKESGTGGRVIALDLSHGMLREGRARRAHPRVHWVCADAGAVPLPAGTAHVLIALHMWPHLDDHEAALREWHRVLCPGGALWIAHLSSRAKINAIHREGSEAIHHDRLPPVVAVAERAERCGFRVEHTEDSEERYLVHAVRR